VCVCSFISTLSFSVFTLEAEKNQENAINEEDILSEFTIFTFAGSDTTSLSLVSAFLHLAKNEFS